MLLVRLDRRLAASLFGTYPSDSAADCTRSLVSFLTEMSDDLSYLLDVCTLSPLLTAEQEIMYGKRIQAGIALTDLNS